MLVTEVTAFPISISSTYKPCTHRYYYYLHTNFFICHRIFKHSHFCHHLCGK
nr:MAG TPA: hypothetical protein [Bacteriophage sp.]